MVFEIGCEKNGKEYSVHYDSSLGILESGGVTYTRGNPFAETPHTNFREITFILGPACNLKCDYCFQQKNKDSLKMARPLKIEAVDGLVAKLEKFDLRAVRKFTMWGGEPLLYFDVLKTLVNRLQEKFPHVSHYFLSTNGLLLDREKLDWLMNHRFSIQISDDGNNDHRGDKLVSDIDRTRQLVREYRIEHPSAKISVHFVLSRTTVDVYQNFKNLEKFYGSGIGISFVPLHAPPEAKTLEDSIYRFTPEEQRLMYTSVYRVFMEYPNVRKYDNCLNMMFRNVKMSGYACPAASGGQITLGSNGEMYVCRESPFANQIMKDSIGELASDSSDIESSKLLEWNRLRDKFFKHSDSRNHCNECLFRTTCRGICSLVDNSKVDILCSGAFPFYYAAMQAIFQREFKTRVKTIKTPCHLSNELVNLGDPEAYEDAKTKYAQSVQKVVRIFED